MSDWQPITTAPIQVDLEVSIYDDGEYHALVFPCRRDSSGWRDLSLNRLVPIKPTHWRPWSQKKNRS
jgi:hypothetical protein